MERFVSGSITTWSARASVWMLSRPRRLRSPVASLSGKEQGLDEHKGVYYTEREGERIYEIGFTEDGKQKWPTIGPDLDEAIAARAAVTEAVAA